MDASKSKIFIALGIVIILVAAGLAYAFWPKSEESKTIKIGVLPVIDTLPLYVAVEDGLFEENGVDIELVQFNSAMERDAAFTTGEIDGYFGDMIAALTMRQAGINAKVVTIDYHTQENYTMFALLASPSSGIDSVDDITDSEVATSYNSISEYFLDEMVSSNNLTEKVTKTSVPQISVRYQSLIAGQVDLAILPEPFVTMAIQDGAVMIENDTSINTTATVIVFDGDIIEENEDLVSSFLDAYGESVQRINAAPADYMDTLIEKINFPEALADEYHIQPFCEPALPSQGDLQRLETWMLEKEMLDNSIPYGDIMATELYQ